MLHDVECLVVVNLAKLIQAVTSKIFRLFV